MKKDILTQQGEKALIHLLFHEIMIMDPDQLKCLVKKPLLTVILCYAQNFPKPTDFQSTTAEFQRSQILFLFHTVLKNLESHYLVSD